MFRRLLLTATFMALSTVADAHDQSATDLVSKIMAAKADTARGGVLYAKRCQSCHGAKAWGDGLEDIPALAGQRELYLITQLAEFTTRERSGISMHRATSTPDVSNPQSLRNLAAFLSLAPPNPDPVHAEDHVLTSGQTLFQHNCAVCHGPDARGSSTDPIPSLAGQHYEYILIQIKNFAKGHRGAVDAPVIDFAAGLSDEEQKAIADYVSRIKPTPPPAIQKRERA